MNLVISGMALSYQWCPSLRKFEENLFEKDSLTPALVEHAGEVIYQSILNAGLSADSRLFILGDLEKVELGHYLPLLKDEFNSLEKLSPVTSSLGDQLVQAVNVLEGQNQNHVVVCDFSQSGTAAVVISHDQTAKNCVSSIGLTKWSDRTSANADYIEISGAVSALDEKIRKIQKLFEPRKSNHPVAVGHYATPGSRSVEILNLIHAASAIKNQVIPASSYPQESFPTDISLEPLYINLRHRPWLARNENFLRSAILICDEQLGSENYLFLEEVESNPDVPQIRFVQGSDPILYVITGNDQDELLAQIDELEILLNRVGSLRQLASNAFLEYRHNKKSLICCLLGKNRDDFQKELDHARTGIRDAFRTGHTWKTPGGSYFTPQPLGNQGIAFVYPGGFNSYPGMGRDLFFSFPWLHKAIFELMPDPIHSMAEDFLYIRNSKIKPELPADLIMDDFYQEPGQLVESGISFSALHTMILDRVFELQPDSAFGYSLGEISMLWANRVWQNAEKSSTSWKNSDLFKDQLVGDMHAVRRYWPDLELPNGFWDSYILKTTVQEAQIACDKETLVFLTIQNTPSEVVIAGEKDACQRVIDDLGCRSLPMPFNASIHNPAMGSTYEDFVDLYSNKTTPQPGIDFFSSADYQKLTINELPLAESMAKMTCSHVDFPRLVHQVYNDGARIFIEIGPQKTCSRWIEKILENKPHAVIPINKKQQRDLDGYFKLISLLTSHGVSVNLAPLFSNQSKTERNKKTAKLKAEKSVIASSDPSPRASIDLLSSPDIKFSKELFHHLDRISVDMSKSHQSYLLQQQTMTRNLIRMMQINSSSSSEHETPNPVRDYLYSKQQIKAFTTGDHRVCFGDTFAGFGDRRIPRLPNGDLQFIDGVISIEGIPNQIKEGSRLVSEYLIPEVSWFRKGKSTELPLVSLMEIGLQPCGFLSAYMGTIKGRESQDLYFRNLDGESTILCWPKTKDQTITTQVQLLSSNSLDDVIIQTFAFELFWGEVPFVKGISSFGYFPPIMLKNQVGLDGDQSSSKWFDLHPREGIWIEKQKAAITNGKAHLPVIDKYWFSQTGGDHSQGYIYLDQQIPSDAWFYHAHFYQDPVMPGSLGVETMARALSSATGGWGIPDGLMWRIKPESNMSWKYRGQITPDTNQVTIELHITNLSKNSNGWEICANGNLWKGSKRIYQVRSLSLESY